MYLADLANSTELLLDARRAPHRAKSHSRIRGHGSARRAAAGVLRLSNAVGAAITGHRVLGPVEAQLMLTAGVLLLACAVAIRLFPGLLLYPVLVMMVWFGLAFLYMAFRLYRERPQGKVNRQKRR